MITCDHSRLLYLCPPKTGTTSVRSVLQARPFFGRIAPPYRHAHHWTKWDERYRYYYIFMTVRHPYTRMVSLWRFACREIAKSLEGGHLEHRPTWWHMNFDGQIPDFMEFMTTPKVKRFMRNVWSCSWHQQQIRRPINRAVRFECLEEDLRLVLGLEHVALPRENVSPESTPWHEYYDDPRLIRKVQELWDLDFEFYDYELDFDRVRDGHYFK